ncbi:hypothetical protein FRB94_006810 [Tulasnella sp. JGI-2019a]|nr:hypothetical protein FRB93_010377 [Tulasnella sp. JGI-2019a]KAG9012010.1 hypothetical protein FRB94_006810 [Tulasnella sp. JGI-2019a]
MGEDLKLDRKIVDETLEELDFLFIDNDPDRLNVDTSSKLGVGGFGEVYQADLFVALAQQTIRVAVKTLRSDPSKDLQVAHRLLREISTWSNLRHPNILSLLGFYLSPNLDTALLVCPLEPLGSVDHFLRDHDLDIIGRMHLVAQAARGIAYLHSLNPPVTHGDIKAANTLLNQQGDAVLCDFGLAKSEFRSGLETSGDFSGSIHFCSPELFMGAERSPSSDMWALGCLAIEIVLGVKPFATLKLLQIMKTVSDGELPASKEALRHPVNMWDGLIHCWHKDPKDRVHASEFLRYWDLKIQLKGAGTDEPVCSKAACRYRRQRLSAHNIIRSLDRILGAIGALAVLAWGLEAFYIIADRLRYNDQNRGRALRALETLPRAKMAGWSAIESRSSCMSGTRAAVLKTIHAWYTDTAPDAPIFFDLDGIAGIGKTTIAHTVAAAAARDGYLAGSFFFTRSGEAELSNPTLVFPTLAYQLASLGPSFALQLGRAVEAAPSAAFEDLRSQLQKLIMAPLQHVTRPSKPLLIVLDALDECQKEGAKELLRLLLSQASKIPFPLKIFVTSRPEPHLSCIFNHAASLHRVILHDIEASIVKSDIRLYLQTSFAEISEKHDLQMGKAWARHDEIEVLVERAQTLFIVAATFTRFAGDDTVRNPRQQLDLLLQRNESSFAGPNTTIDELYLQILRKIRSTTGSPLIIERLRSMIGAMVTLHNPLPIPAIERLLGLPEGDGSRALHHLRSIVSIPRSPIECPRIHHASFPDFIADPSRCTEPDLCISLGTYEAGLATRCLKLAIFSIETGLSRQELEYASRWGPNHLSKSGADESHTMDLMEAFASRCLIWYFEAIDPSPSYKFANVRLTEANSRAMLRRSQSLACSIAAVALDSGQTRRAVELLQHVHDNSIGRLEQYRAAIDTLIAERPGLATEFLDLSVQLTHFIDPNCPNGKTSGQVALHSDSVEKHHNLSTLWIEALKRIQELPAFVTFLKPIPCEHLSSTAQGRALIVNITELRSDVIALRPGAEPIVIELRTDMLQGIGPKSWTLPWTASPSFHQSTTLAGNCLKLLKYDDTDQDRAVIHVPPSIIERAMDSSQLALNEAGTRKSQAGEGNANPTPFSDARQSVQRWYETVLSKKAGLEFINDMDDARMRDKLGNLTTLLDTSSLPDSIRSSAAAIPAIILQIYLISRNVNGSKKASRELALHICDEMDATLRLLQNFKADFVEAQIKPALAKLHQSLTKLLQCFREQAEYARSTGFLRGSLLNEKTIEALLTRVRDTKATIQALQAGRPVPQRRTGYVGRIFGQNEDDDEDEDEEDDIGDCILCRHNQKVAGTQFCGRRCAQLATQQAPLILPISEDDSTFDKITDQFHKSWRHSSPLPEIQQIYKIIQSKDLMDRYYAYREFVEDSGNFVLGGMAPGNERRRWHGTRRVCDLGDDPTRTRLCDSNHCGTCGILRTSFKLVATRDNIRDRIGRGIHTSSTSSRAHDYSKTTAIESSRYLSMLLTTVVLGKAYKASTNGETLSAPPGYHSVLRGVGNELNYDDIVVYNEDAIRPAWLIIYDKE